MNVNAMCEFVTNVAEWVRLSLNPAIWKAIAATGSVAAAGEFADDVADEIFGVAEEH